MVPESTNDGDATPIPQHGTAQNEHNVLKILNAIRQMIRAADIDSRHLASAHRITGPQLMCLMAIAEKDLSTAAQVARRIHLSPSTLVGILDRLEAKGLIRRERNPEDRRQVYVTATEEGQTLVARTPFPLQYSLDRAMKQLSEEQQGQMAECVERLVRLMGAHEMDTGPMLEIIGLHTRQRTAL